VNTERKRLVRRRKGVQLRVYFSERDGVRRDAGCGGWERENWIEEKEDQYKTGRQG